ncbi:MAG: DUF1549 domain-containing protein, partial [Terriglobia bacterium]
MRTTALLALAAASLRGDDAAELFARVVEPALKKDCYGCHGDGQILSKLDLRTREAALRGGARGPALVPGSASSSLLYQVPKGKDELQMPPGGESKRLPDEVIEAVRRWIDEGAPFADAKVAAAWQDYKEEDLWALRPLRREFLHNSIDGFLNAKIAESALKPAPRATRRDLIRRATIDLTGLYPTPEEVEAGEPWDQRIDRLLASPRYGERWGRHWLDVVRYADTSGYSNDFERPNAWRYRDYVIRSFNANKPYDRFVVEQIAGDELDAGNPEAVIATGFLRSGPWEHTGMSVEAVTRQMFLDDVTHNAATVFLGLTAGCARCHDHKFDPIPTRDYYRLQAIFATTEFARPRLAFLPAENTAGLPAGKARLEQIARRTQARIDAIENLIRERAAARNQDPAEAVRNQKHITQEEFEELKLHKKHMQLHRESLDRY